MWGIFDRYARKELKDQLLLLAIAKKAAQNLGFLHGTKKYFTAQYSTVPMSRVQLKNTAPNAINSKTLNANIKTGFAWWSGSLLEIL